LSRSPLSFLLSLAQNLAEFGQNSRMCLVFLIPTPTQEKNLVH
jgi:hypothetical protein